jgi:hypothetical protein
VQGRSAGDFRQRDVAPFSRDRQPTSS